MPFAAFPNLLDYYGAALCGRARRVDGLGTVGPQALYGTLATGSSLNSGGGELLPMTDPAVEMSRNKRRVVCKTALGVIPRPRQ